MTDKMITRIQSEECEAQEMLKTNMIHMIQKSLNTETQVKQAQKNILKAERI